ncbi:MAG: succinyl-diaminopimelate desuccinylase [Gemmobacter sp.]
MSDPVALTRALIRCPSVTPADAGALALVEGVLSAAGFACTRVNRGGVGNLFARWGARGHPRTFGFNGHTDVVPPGPAEGWSVDPFGGIERDGMVWGRGAADMKSGVAAFVCAAARFVADTPPDGAVIVTVTGDEEGPGLDGTAAILDWMAANGEAMTACLVGEPTSVARFGDTIKIGRRGSLTGRITATGVQGHAAYPHRARNPLPVLVRLLDRLASHRLDDGTAHFDPSTLAITTVDTGNAASNVIPGAARAVVNIRYNDRHTAESLGAWLRAEAAAAAEGTGVVLAVDATSSGEAFLTPPGPLPALVAAAVRDVAGVDPALSTSGGTSDARFVRAHCPVVEFGLAGATMHQVDERVEAAQIAQLAAVYTRVLAGYFA